MLNNCKILEKTIPDKKYNQATLNQIRSVFISNNKKWDTIICFLIHETILLLKTLIQNRSLQFKPNLTLQIAHMVTTTLLT